MYESARTQYPRVLVWALARGASNNFDACAPFFPSTCRRDTIDVLCTWPSYERRAASPTRLALGYYTYKHTCIVTIPLFPCTLVVRVLRSCSLHPGGASTMLTHEIAAVAQDQYGYIPLCFRKLFERAPILALLNSR